MEQPTVYKLEKEHTSLSIVTLLTYRVCRVYHVKCQAEIKIAGRNINNLRYARNTTPMEESEEELKSLLRTVEEEIEKAVLKFSIQKLRSWHPV